MKEYRLKTKPLWICFAWVILQPDAVAALAAVPLCHFDTTREQVMKLSYLPHITGNGILTMCAKIFDLKGQFKWSLTCPRFLIFR